MSDEIKPERPVSGIFAPEGVALTAEMQSKIRHDLRTPINQIIGYSELLEEEAMGAAQEGMVPDLKKIQTAARRLLSMIDSIFMSSGKQVAPPVKEGPEPPDATGMKWKPVKLDVESGPPPAPEKGPGEGTLLVVDDNELNRDMLSRRLRGRSYSVAVAEDGEHALSAVAADRFDAVLLDVMMPGISGIEVLKILRKKYSVADLPVIMATAMDDSEDIVEALKLGANDYVTKPLDFPVVLARLETQLSLKRAKERVQRLAEELEKRNRFIRKTFGRYLSDDVVASLLESEEGLKLGGENRTVTILMSDLRGFTAVSERLAPEQVVRILNNYLGKMADIITQYRGTIDEFIGDAILAIFGAPVKGEDDAARAVACALDMQRAMEAVNSDNASEGLPPIEMGIALNTGDVVVGNIGSQTRAKYGIVGSHVNLTARIESFSVGGQILISDWTRKSAGDVKIGKKILVNAKGFSEPITAYELHGIRGAFEIDLPQKVETLVAVEKVPIRFTIIKEKTVGEESFDGRLVKLGPHEAEVESLVTVSAHSNLRLRIVSQDFEIPADVYAKVVESDETPGAFKIHFTSVPPEAQAFLSGLLKSA